MSTTFDVYPGKEYIPSFAELLDISNKKVNDFLRNLGISKNITIDVEVRQIDDDFLEIYLLAQKG